jgi:hypothetical protein
MVHSGSKQKDMFDSLVKNAIDFFKRSISELEKSPKYSLINFVAAIELFLKARLMLEHWSLIIDKPQDANISNFLNGNFKSIGIEEAVQRLKNIAGVTITEEERSSFNQMREHRNKLIHFFHPNYVTEPDSATLHSVVSEECKGWFFLHRLLTSKWGEEFIEYTPEINDLQTMMVKQRGFLKAKFDDVRLKIENRRASGAIFTNCPYCGFESNEQETILANSIIIGKCLVCEESVCRLMVPCPNPGCNKVSLILIGEDYKCESCGYSITIDYLIKIFHQMWVSSGDNSQLRLAYCSDCVYTQRPTVLPVEDKWFCMYCLTVHDTVNKCEWCGEWVTGETGTYYSPGCVMCAVHIRGEATYLEKGS